MTKDLEGEAGQLQENKWFDKEKKRKRESKQPSEGQQAKHMSRRLRGSGAVERHLLFDLCHMVQRLP